jgi:hypothetical protein
MKAFLIFSTSLFSSASLLTETPHILIVIPPPREAFGTIVPEVCGTNNSLPCSPTR